MTCKYKVKIKDIQYNYKVQMTDIQSKYKFKVFCTGYDDSEIKEKIDAMYQAWPKVSGEGETITLNDTANTTMAIDLKGNTIQDGEPTPDAPVDVSVVSGDNEIKVEGKNLFNDYYSGADAVLRGVTKKAGDNCVILNGTYDKIYNLDLWLTDSNSSTTGNMVLLKANTQYSVSIILEGTYSFNFTTAWISSRTLDNTFSWNYKTLEYSNGEFKGTFTTGNTDIYIGGIRLPISTTCDATFTNTKVKIQVEEGQPTDYQEYKGTTYQITLPEGTELCKIGDYKDRIYPLNGKWYLEKQIGKVVFNGTEGGGAIYDNGQRFGYTSNNVTEIANALINTPTSVSNLTPIYSNRFTSSTQNGVTPTSNTIGFSQWGTTKYIYLSAIESTVADYKNWLSNNNVEVYFPLATPTTEEITDSTLISQLEEIKEAESYSGQTNISQTNDDKPFILTATALKDLSSL